MVPLLIPRDSIEGLRRITAPDVRLDAGVSRDNPFVFASIHNSDSHIKGWNAVNKVVEESGVGGGFTATKMRHRVSTIYAALEVPDTDRRAFFEHMGHSELIKKHVYQTPMAVKEITTVGKFLHGLDRTTRENERAAESQHQAYNATELGTKYATSSLQKQHNADQKRGSSNKKSFTKDSSVYGAVKKQMNQILVIRGCYGRGLV